MEMNRYSAAKRHEMFPETTLEPKLDLAITVIGTVVALLMPIVFIILKLS
jgi:hypothetical protein